MSFTGYYQRPTLACDRVVFVFEDDLWLYNLQSQSPTAFRLTANPGRANDPQLSPDGTHLAYTSLDEGHPEVYVTRLDNMSPQRLTYLGEDTRCIGWSRDGKDILFTTNAGNPFNRIFQLAKVSREGGPCQRIPYGPAAHLSFAPKRGQVLGRHTWDPARWKRYRGGTAGQIWVDHKETGDFTPLLELDGNLTRPLWVGARIYFGSDHEGICNIYSCKPDGTDLKKHTDHQDFYIRYPNSDGKRLVYQCGGDIYLLDPKKKSPQKLPIEVLTPRPHLARKFVSPGRYLESYTVSPDGSQTGVGVRGKVFTFPHWEGAVRQLGERDGVRYRLLRWGPQGPVCVSDLHGEEEIGLFDEQAKGQYRSLTRGHEIGRVLELGLSPCGERLWFTNHRHELFALAFPKPSKPSEGAQTEEPEGTEVPAEPELALVTRDRYSRIGGASWSPDGFWLAYSESVNRQDSRIFLWSWEQRQAFAVTQPAFRDWAPDFDPDGRYLYFLSCRDFDPVRDNLFFEFSFPKAARPYLVTLQEEQPDPFLPRSRAPGEEPPAFPSPYIEDPKTKETDSQESSEEIEEIEDNEDAEGREESPDDSASEVGSKPEEPEKPKRIKVDLRHIERRVRAFPLEEGRYFGVIGLKDKVAFGMSPVRSTLNLTAPPSEGPSGLIGIYDFKKLDKTFPLKSVSGFDASLDRSTLVVRSGSSLRVLKAAAIPTGNERTAGRETGWLDLSKIKVSIKPRPEWRQMLREAWRLMRDHFWDPDMSKVDWREVLERYEPLLERLATRREFSDLLWEFQGELGTSHAYEYGGDYQSGPHYAQGKLAASVAWREEDEAYVILEIAEGDPWSEDSTSPLRLLHHPLKAGDLLLEVNGQTLDLNNPPEKFLVNQAEQRVHLTVKRRASHRGEGEPEPEVVTVKALRRETPIRYREWVESNKRLVHQRSEGKLGYIHIPNMSASGYAEFHRHYYSEIEREGLIVDVRYNGGGNVSQLLLEKLARRRVGFDVQRWGEPIPYPQESPAGPLVALTNEQAGSDGDIFSHCFKLMGLGPLLGKRTWGGTIGIWPRHPLVDGTVTTQPEFAFWFTDVGWGVENYGTDPDEVIEHRPQDWTLKKDPQLERAIVVALEQVHAHPTLDPKRIERNR